MARNPEFLLLKSVGGWLPGDDWKQLLGAAVKNYLSPFEASTPSKPLAYNKAKLIDNEYDDLVLKRDLTTDSSGKLSLKGLGMLHYSKSDSHHLDLRGKHVYIKRLRQHDDFWANITKSDEFSNTVAGWLSEKTLVGLGPSKYPVCLVVGLLICQDVEIVESQKEIDERKKKGELPLGTIVEAAAASHGIPLNINKTGNIAAKSSSKAVDKTYFAAKGKKWQIFALELKKITTKGGDLKLSDKAPKSSYKLGPQDVEGQDLEVGELSAEDWDILLEE